MTSTPTKPVDNVVIATKGLQDRYTNIIAGTTVENKGKLILKEWELHFIDLNIQVIKFITYINNIERVSNAIFLQNNVKT